VYFTTSLRFGQATLASSLRTSRENSTTRSGSPGRSGDCGRRAALRALFVYLALSLQETFCLSVHETFLGSKER
jgi:hypothetical protein